MAKRALVIANSEYEDDFFTALPAAEADAAALAGVLADPAVGEFTVEQVVNAGQRAAMRAIHAFFADAQRDDLLVLHLSLHGWKDLRNRLYFVARDTERDVLEATAISADFVSERMSWSKSARIVLLLDCCYSGAFAAGMLRRSGEAPQVDVAEPFAGKGRMVVTASTSLQFAHEGQPEVRLSRDQAQPSLFTAAVVQGLRDGSADLDGDGLISVNELYDYVSSSKSAARYRARLPLLAWTASRALSTSPATPPPWMMMPSLNCAALSPTSRRGSESVRCILSSAFWAASARRSGTRRRMRCSASPWTTTWKWPSVPASCGTAVAWVIYRRRT